MSKQCDDLNQIGVCLTAYEARTAQHKKADIKDCCQTYEQQDCAYPADQVTVKLVQVARHHITNQQVRVKY